MTPERRRHPIATDRPRVGGTRPGSVAVVPTDTSVVVTGALTGADLAALTDAATDIAAWPAGSHVWGHYAEQTAHGPAICRTENVSACRPEVRALVDGPLGAVASARLGVEAEAFKDKINYKQPGGAGFLPHQDRHAYPGAPDLVSLLVAIDACTEASGCLWIATGVDHLLPTDDRGVVEAHVTDALDWEMVELAPGDALVIDGWLPHWSDANHTDAARRVLVASYAPAGSGYTRESYYTARAAEMATSTERDGRFRISTHADFAGEEVAPDARADTACTHA
jgi:hypothetical protein